MVPREEVENAQPATLPADFSEWDNGEASVVKPVKQATARVAVSAKAVRPQNGGSNRTAAAHEDVEKLFQARRSDSAKVAIEKQKVESESEADGKGRRKVMAAVAGSVVVLLAAGFMGYARMRPGQVAAKSPVVTQPATTNVVLPMPTSLPAASQTAQPAPTASDRTLRTRTDLINSQLNAPSRISSDLKMLAGKEPPPSAGFGTATEGLGAGTGSNVFSGRNGPSVKVAAPRVMNISAGVAGGLLVQKTAPVYPQIAKQARVSGTVVIHATISKAGMIQNPHVVNGPTMLRQPALDAVKTWRYRPYMLDGEPVEVETTVSVTFTLGG